MRSCTIHTGDALAVLRTLPAESVQCCVTSPPYWGLRDYGVDGQIGLETTPQEFVARLVAVFEEVRRVLRPDGVLWCNMGDSYNANQGAGFNGNAKRPDSARNTRMPNSGLRPKQLLGQPWRLAFALQDAGWWLRSDCIWHKPNPMPESVTDRPTKSHEYVFLLTKGTRYFYDADAVRTPLAAGTLGTYGRRRRSKGTDALGAVAADNWARDVPIRKPRLNANGEHAGANMRTVWTIATQPCREAHFATFPEALAERCILAGSRVGDTVLDPFTGAGTTGLVAAKLGRAFVGCELNPEYVAIAEKRIHTAQLRMLGAL